MKRKKDTGLSYIQQLGIRSYRTWDAFFKDIYDEYGAGEGERIEYEICNLKMSSNSDYTNVDRITGGDIKLANMWQGQADADVVRKSCNWIERHKDLFGAEILEVGCGYGYISGFLGMMFPDRRIVSIDRNEHHIAIARQNAERLGVKNIDFAVADVFEYDGSFDTVVSSRVAHEIITDPDYQDDLTYAPNPIKKVPVLKADLEPYARKIRGLLHDNGNIVFLERFDRDPRLFAFIDALCENEMRVSMVEHEELHCEDIDTKISIQAFMAQKGCPVTETALELYGRMCLLDVNLDWKYIEGADAYNAFWLRRKEMLYGARITQNKRKSLYCLCTLDGSPDKIYSYVQTAVGAALEYQTDIENAEAAVEEVREFIDDTFYEFEEIQSVEEL